MSKTAITLIVIGVLVLFSFIYGVTTYNGFVGSEEGISAIDKDMQNVHASIHKQMRGQGISIEKYGDLVIKAMTVSMEGRYGPTGSHAAVQLIHEQNPNIPSDIMAKLQETIESGYNRFEATQRTKIDKGRVYKQNLRSFPKNIVAAVCGFPKIDLAFVDRILTSAETKHDFETGELSDPDPFGEKNR